MTDETEAPAPVHIHSVDPTEKGASVRVFATANSPLNDIVHARGGKGRVSFTAKDANGLTFKDNGDSTFTLGGKAPSKDKEASLNVSYADEGDQKGSVAVAVVGSLSPHAHVAAEQVRQHGA